MPSLWVQKYGGTSVGSPERILSVADRIAATRAQGHSLVVAVSAMGHTTDELIELAKKVSRDPPGREMDMLLTTGERVSMALLSMALADRKVPAISLTGSQSGIVTDGAHRRARIRRILGDRIRAGLAQGQVVIVAGFQGVSEEKEITTLGRGGTDTTAVALAACLKAERCQIYTDVDGVFSADPRVVSQAKLLPRVPASLMVELAVRGAGVLHPRSVELAEQAGVRVQVLHSFPIRPTEGTEVLVQRDQEMEAFGIAGVTAGKDKLGVSIELARDTVLGAIWDRSQQSHLNLVAPLFTGAQLQFFTDREGAPEWRRHLEDLVAQGFVKSYRIHDELVPVSVVGHRFSQDGSALAEIFDQLAKEHLQPRWGVASSLAVTVAVVENQADDAVRALHSHWVGG